MSDIEIDAFLLPTPIQTFTCFPALPTELQLQIWESADQDPITIQIKTSDQKVMQRSPGDDHEREIEILQAKAVYTIPAMLHTCRDSRAAALPHYRLCFEEYLGHPIFFRYGIDMLSMESPSALCSFLKTPWFADLEVGPDEISKVRNLEIGGRWVTYAEAILQRMYVLRGVERLVLERVEETYVMERRVWAEEFKRRWCQVARYQEEVLGDCSMGQKSLEVEFR